MLGAGRIEREDTGSVPSSPVVPIQTEKPQQMSVLVSRQLHSEIGSPGWEKRGEDFMDFNANQHPVRWRLFNRAPAHICEIFLS